MDLSQADTQRLEYAGALQCADDEHGDDGTGDRVEQEGGHEGEECRGLAHEQDCDGVGQHRAQNTGAANLTGEGGRQALDALVEQTGEQCADHGTGEGQQAAGADQVADERGDKG